MLSRPETIAPILYALDEWFTNNWARLSEFKICDIGPGWGKWGLMVREIVASRMAESGDMTPDVKTRLTTSAVEMCEYFKTITERHQIYDSWINGDIRRMATLSLSMTFPVDVYLAFDVFEHWTTCDITRVVSNLFRINPDAAILVSIPCHVTMYEQPYYGEDCPKHESSLTPANYREMFPELKVDVVWEKHSYIFWLYPMKASI